MSGRPNFLVRLAARLLRPVVAEILDMGGRDAPLPWAARPVTAHDDEFPAPPIPRVVEIDGGGALFAEDRRHG